MKKIITKFFWLSLGLGMTMVFTNMKDYMLSKSMQPKSSAIPGVKVSAPSEVTSSQVKMKTPSVANGWTKTEQGWVSATGRTLVKDERRYVQIDGRWILERADHTYMVNGVKTFFVDNARAEDAESLKKESVGSKVAKAADDLGETIKSGAVGVMSGEAIAQMQRTLVEAKAKMDERDEALKKLTESPKGAE